MGPKSAKSAKYRVFCGYTWKTRVYLENTLRPPGYRADFLNFASDFAPDQLSDSGKLASFQNGAPNTLCFPWKFPETQSAGDPLFSFLFSGKLCSAQAEAVSSKLNNVCVSRALRINKINKQNGHYTKQGVGEGQGPHLREQDLVRTIRDTHRGVPCLL